MADRNPTATIGARGRVSRRDFLKTTQAAAASVGFGLALPGLFWVTDAVAAMPASGGYLLVDTKKCQGCASCMLACSLVHHGVENPSRSRIQVIQNSFAAFPDDVTVEPCRQCVEAACVAACPTGALKPDARHTNVRVVNPTECIGCGSCLAACPYTPSRVVLAYDEPAGDAPKAQKCDLCASAPFHWDAAGGGPGGQQACVEVCPVRAIRFSAEIPVQEGDAGYKVNLRGDSWGRLGYPKG